MKKLLAFLSSLIVVALSITGCATPAAPPTNKGPITIGSKIDTEGALLGQTIILILRSKGFQVNDKTQTGQTQIVRQALISGEIDIYPEYTGNGAFFFDETTSDVWKDAQKGWERVKLLDKQKNNIVWLKPAPANNTWAIAVPKTLADKEKLTSLDDFAAYVNRGGTVKLAGSEEFVTSPVALPAFEQAYGFDLKGDQLVTLPSGNTAQTEKYAAEATQGVNAAMAYGTDGDLSALGLVVLTDPRGVQPVYEPAPIVRGETYDKYPEIATILDPVFQSLDLVTLQTLNAKIAVEGQNATNVAREYLTSKGFLK